MPVVYSYLKKVDGNYLLFSDGGKIILLGNFRLTPVFHDIVMISRTASDAVDVRVTDLNI